MGEPYIPDLSQPDDMGHPVNRLKGIGLYCQVLMNSYANDAREWWKYRDWAETAYEGKRRGETGAEDQHQSYREASRTFEQMCVTWHKQLCDLTKAMALVGSFATKSTGIGV